MGLHRFSIGEQHCGPLDGKSTLCGQGDTGAVAIAQPHEMLADKLTGNSVHDDQAIASAVDDHVLCVGRANVSWAISDLVKAGLLRRHYAGYATDHPNRGGGRHAVYVIEIKAITRALRAAKGSYRFRQMRS